MRNYGSTQRLPMAIRNAYTAACESLPSRNSRNRGADVVSHSDRLRRPVAVNSIDTICAGVLSTAMAATGEAIY